MGLGTAPPEGKSAEVGNPLKLAPVHERLEYVNLWQDLLTHGSAFRQACLRLPEPLRLMLTARLLHSLAFSAGGTTLIASRPLVIDPANAARFNPFALRFSAHPLQPRQTLQWNQRFTPSWIERSELPLGLWQIYLWSRG